MKRAFEEFLLCPTPAAWYEEAMERPAELLIDHANCEKKAAGTALGLLYRYVDRPALLDKLSRLAREELRHFEQVLEVMRGQGVVYAHLSASRYASSLRELVRTSEPERLTDTLLVGAIVEARSAERFSGLARRFADPLGRLYQRLLESEARHFEDYLELAHCYSDHPFDDQLGLLLERDRELVCSRDADFRFHSGLPA